MRKKIIIGNWKMNKTQSEIKKYISDLKKEISKKSINSDFGIAPSSIYLSFVKELLKEQKKIIISAQDAHFNEKGAFTGNDSWSQIKDCGIKYSIIGHSERREMFGETDETVNKKVLSLLANKMIPILCVGENLEERENKEHTKVVNSQLEKAFKNVTIETAKNVIIAYEPIWAIGTGKSASSEDAEKMCASIRKKIEALFDKNTADKIRIMYGGSVNNSNAKEYLLSRNIDGALVGGASLDAKKFIELIREVE